MDLIKKYKKIATLVDNTPKVIDSFVPTPNNKDYKRGYITRFFIQKSNDKKSPIHEVSSQNFRKYSTSKLYRGVNLKWRIKGPLKMMFNENSTISDIGVSESNKKAIDLVSNSMPDLKLYLVHLLQFYKS
jgi:hypothetical protein